MLTPIKVQKETAKMLAALQKNHPAVYRQETQRDHQLLEYLALSELQLMTCVKSKEWREYGIFTLARLTDLAVGLETGQDVHYFTEAYLQMA